MLNVGSPTGNMDDNNDKNRHIVFSVTGSLINIGG